jgi:hypothetical protein
MGLDVDPPAPPELATVDPSTYDDAEVAGDEYHRDDLERFLAEGAWVAAFERWAAETHLSEESWRVVEDLELIAQFDFFWDDFADRVGYHAPGLPADWRERDLHPALSSWEQVSAINASLTELGAEVSDTLKADYVDWESSFEAPDDLPEFD